MKKSIKLEYDKIIHTLIRLEKRISERFPESGLREVINDFLQIAVKSEKNIEWISKPHLVLRFMSFSVIFIAIGGILFSLAQIDFSMDFKINNIIQTSEAFINEMVLIGAAIFFMTSIENRVKRHKASKFLNELRVIAHVIDMHQLTKDPGLHDDIGLNTENSPSRVLNAFELQRYLDYCSEAFSLIGKVAALYAQSLPNDVVVRTVNEIEDLSSGLSRKVWQKLIILNELVGREELQNKNKVGLTISSKQTTKPKAKSKKH